MVVSWLPFSRSPSVPGIYRVDFRIESQSHTTNCKSSAQCSVLVSITPHENLSEVSRRPKVHPFDYSSNDFVRSLLYYLWCDLTPSVVLSIFRNFPCKTYSTAIENLPPSTSLSLILAGYLITGFVYPDGYNPLENTVPL